MGTIFFDRLNRPDATFEHEVFLGSSMDFDALGFSPVEPPQILTSVGLNGGILDDQGMRPESMEVSGLMSVVDDTATYDRGEMYNLIRSYIETMRDCMRRRLLISIRLSDYDWDESLATAITYQNVVVAEFSLTGRYLYDGARRMWSVPVRLRLVWLTPTTLGDPMPEGGSGEE